MYTTLQAIGSPLSWYDGSATTEITNSLSGLRLIVAAGGDDDRFVEVHFPYAKAFQVLDDSDMLEYWHKERPLGKHILFQVLSGGWVQRTEGHYFQVTSSHQGMREWLLVTDAGPCVTIVSTYEPFVRHYGTGA